LGETLTVRNNFLGLNSEGTAAMPSLFALILATNTGAAPFDIRDNRFGAGGTTQVGVNVAAAGGASISGNTFGLGTGGQDLGFPNSAVRIVGSNVSVSGNTVGHGGAGVLVEGGDQNTLTGNTIGVGPGGSHAGTSGAGVAIRDRSALTDPAIGNTVGGDDAASENVISNGGTDAIEISGTPGALPQGNTVKRNRGTGNAGLFVDLGTDGFGDSTGANGGALPPTITSVTPTGASGTAGAGHTVRVFRAGGTAGSIEGFVGQAVADAGGAWSVTYAAPLAEGQLVTAAATDAAGNSSEYAPAVATAGPPAQPEGQGGGGEVGGGSATTPVVDTSRPNIAVAMRPSAFPAATRGDSIGSAGRRTGTTVTYRLSEPARAAFTVERRTVGRRVGRRCRRATRSNRSRRKCTLYVRVRGGFAHSGAAGTNRFHFTGRMNGRALKPARYRLVAGATDSAGNRSATKRRPFRIVR